MPTPTGKQSTITLNNGVEMPYVGLGTWTLRGDEAVRLTKIAFEAGYRLLDSAEMYNNEEAIGRAVRESGLPREEVFVTTKLSKPEQGYDPTLKAADASLRRLGLDVMDLYLIHWPQHDNKRADTWRAMEKIYHDGKARAIGVSNYDVRHLEDVMNSGEVTPAVNQIELHPFNYGRQREVIEFCQREGIVVESYSPLTEGQHLNDARLTEIAEAHGVSTAQVLIRWVLQHGFVVIPRSDNPAHIRDNIDIFDFELTGDEMARLDSIG